MTSPQTKSSTPRLSEVAKELRVPSGIVTTGWPAVRDRCKSFGIGFDLWQHGIGSIALGKRADGSYAASVGGVVISIPRQTGKTYLFGWMVFALCTIFPGLTVIWTAHRTRTSNETFEKMRSMAKKAKVQPYIETVRSTNGEQAIVFKNGSRILFGAREQGFGRGFDKVDILVLDEAQILTEAAMTDMVPATNAAPNGLVLMMGTPPRPKDPGEVFTNRRKDALAGDPDTALVELGADPGSKIIDWDQLAKANPSFPHRTSRTAILRMQKLLGSDINFYREAYGIWDETNVEPTVISPSRWSDLAIPAAKVPDGIRSFGVKFSADGTRVSLSVAVKPPEGPLHVELIESRSMAGGIDWLVAALVAVKNKAASIVIDGRSDAKTLYNALREAKVSPKALNLGHPLVTSEMAVAANSTLLNAVKSGTITHLSDGQDVLDDAIKCGIRRPIGTAGGWGWQGITEDDDVTPVESICLALYGAMTSKRRPGRKAVIL